MYIYIHKYVCIYIYIYYFFKERFPKLGYKSTAS